MWGLSKVWTGLLAASNPFSMPKTTTDIATSFRNLYQDLGEKAPIYKQISPTIKFSFVTPPSFERAHQHWSEDDVIYSDAHLLESHPPHNANTTICYEQIANKHGRDKPIAIYLPGLDGFGISAARWQFDDLSRTFELWRLTVQVNDRSSFSQLLTAVSDFIDEISRIPPSSTSSTSSSTEHVPTKDHRRRPVYIIAESFGGLLAPGVALRLQNRQYRGGPSNPIQGLVLVNPATSFESSNWDVVAPFLTAVSHATRNLSPPAPLRAPSPYAILGGFVLGSLIPSQEQFQRIIDLLLKIEVGSSLSDIAETMDGIRETFDVVEEFLPAETLDHRITKWLMVGSSLVNPRLQQLNVPTLIIAGGDDKLINSGREANRLCSLLPNSEKLIVNRAGHFVLDENINLTEAILYSKLDPLNFKETRKPYDPILDWKLPPKDVVENTFHNVVRPLEEAFSPIYISTDTNGRRTMGLNNLPREGPLLFVSNHQLCK